VEYPRLMTAMITPFDGSMEVDLAKARKLASYLVDSGSGGIVVCGTTGESPTLAEEEKLALFEAVVQEVGSRAMVWAGVGGNDTAKSAALARKASKCGVHGLMVVAPYYNKPSQEGLYRHFALVAEAADLPIMIYNIPGRTSVNVLPETIARLSEIPNVAAVKEASGSLDQVTQLLNLTRDRLVVYSGDDFLTLPMMAVGAYGVVSVASHLVGRMIKEMIDSYVEGKVKEARNLHAKLFPLFKVLFITTNPAPLKEALRLMGMDTGLLRLPLVGPGEKEAKEIAAVLESFGLI